MKPISSVIIALLLCVPTAAQRRADIPLWDGTPSSIRHSDGYAPFMTVYFPDKPLGTAGDSETASNTSRSGRPNL